MRTADNLAIIIPAYKKQFLRQTLESIAAQTAKNFTLYIGDDASPENLYEIVKDFEKQLQIVYRRFEKNLGGYDLVAHWNRCIEMAGEEQWIWLFSDDDLMEKNCVATINAYTKKNPLDELLHFDVKVIDQHNAPLHEHRPFPENFDASELFAKKVQLKITSTIVEYVFKKDLFVREGGFEWYDLAWGSDDATWMKFAKGKSIPTLSGAFVYWRYSGFNISSSLDNIGIITRKVEANVVFINWTAEFFRTHKLPDKTTSFQKLKWALQSVKMATNLTMIEKLGFCRSITSGLGQKSLFAIGAGYLVYSDFKAKYGK